MFCVGCGLTIPFIFNLKIFLTNHNSDYNWRMFNQKSKSYAIIPARGGSKRIPRKNIRLLNGIPLIGITIQNALLSGVFEEIIVSTDDLEIATIAKNFGATVPFIRDSNLADDFTPTVPVIRDAIEKAFFESVLLIRKSP